MSDNIQNHTGEAGAQIEPMSVVAKAIIATKVAIGTITKDANNPFHKYKYVPIDAYYEHVASKAAENSLTWRTNLVDLQVFSEGVDDRGRPTSILRFHFAVDLFHADGVVVHGWQNIIILHPVQGAQTTGSALSYAEKLFMRTTFSVTTAEDDTDGKNTDFQTRAFPANRPPGPPPRTAQPAPPPRPARAPAPAESVGASPHHPAISDVAAEIVAGMDEATNTPVLAAGALLEGKWDMVSQIMTTFLDMCPTTPALVAFWKNNFAAMEALQQGDPALYEHTLAAFKARRAALEAK